MKYVKSYLDSVNEGISYNSEQDTFDFNWHKDAPDDLINLKLQRYNRYLSLKNSIQLYYAYKFNKKNGKVLVVDDILTEGTTLSNMTRLLENIGANSITGFILFTN